MNRRGHAAEAWEEKEGGEEGVVGQINVQPLDIIV